jgi:hypothetical protein
MCQPNCHITMHPSTVMPASNADAMQADGIAITVATAFSPSIPTWLGCKGQHSHASPDQPQSLHRACGSRCKTGRVLILPSTRATNPITTRTAQQVQPHLEDLAVEAWRTAWQKAGGVCHCAEVVRRTCMETGDVSFRSGGEGSAEGRGLDEMVCSVFR